MEKIELKDGAIPPILAEVQFGNPRTHPECIYIGICSLRSDDDDIAAGGCPSAKAWVSRTGNGLKIQFLRPTVQPCALAKQFAGDIFRITSPCPLTEKFAASLGLPKNAAWEIPQGDFPVRRSADFLTVDFPLTSFFEIKKSSQREHQPAGSFFRKRLIFNWLQNFSCRR